MKNGSQPKMNAMGKGLILICSIGAVLIPLASVHSRIPNLAFFACLAGMWAGFVVLFWKRKWMRVGMLLLPVFLALPFFLPGREIRQEELREGYVQRTLAFEGTRYSWGGESSRGIDCSGLPRRAFRDALLAYGIRHGNGHAFRKYGEQWWFDASAKALDKGYRNYTCPIGVGGTIRQMDYGSLQAGDLAITVGGAHVLVYVGDGRWIQADPGGGAVAAAAGRTSNNAWFKVPVTVHRWKLLTSP